VPASVRGSKKVTFVGERTPPICPFAHTVLQTYCMCWSMYPGGHHPGSSLLAGYEREIAYIQMARPAAAGWNNGVYFNNATVLCIPILLA
jgi:hypothetical protein